MRTALQAGEPDHDRRNTVRCVRGTYLRKRTGTGSGSIHEVRCDWGSRSKQLDTFGPKILKDDYAPGFFMKHFIKDMKLALIEANRKGLSLDVLSMVLANYEELEQEGYGDLGTQALMKFYDEEHRNTEE